MNLNSCDDREDVWGYRALYVSECGIWRIGTYRVLYGVRAVAWRKGLMHRSVDLCAGDDALALKRLLALLHGVFSHLPEGISAREVERLMPSWTQRPVVRDLRFMNALTELALGRGVPKTIADLVA